MARRGENYVDTNLIYLFGPQGMQGPGMAGIGRIVRPKLPSRGTAVPAAILFDEFEPHPLRRARYKLHIKYCS